MNTSGEAVLYDLIEQDSASEAKDKCAPQWKCSDVLCKLPPDWLSLVKQSLLSLTSDDKSSMHATIRHLYEESRVCLTT